MTEPLLKIEDLEAGYEKEPVLTGVTFSANPGEAVAVIGPNGAGKSTLLLAAADRWQREKKTVRELVSEGRYPYTGRLGTLDEKDWAVVKAAMQKTDTLSLSGRDIGELSDGQVQRTYIARALAQEPSLLILDEPTGFLDVRYQLEIIGLLKELCHNAERPITLLMTLHDLALLPKVADRVLMLKEGKQVGYGPAEEMLTAERLASLFDIPREEAAVYLPGQAPTVRKGRKHLRYGFTTGTAAALAAKGAAELLLEQAARQEAAEDPLSRGEGLSLMTPKGMEVTVRPERLERRGADAAVCSVRKDAGDDPDATDGILIKAEVRKKAGKVPSSRETDAGMIRADRVEIRGGAGIGTVTKPGLDQPVGAAAINSVPRQMISAACREVMAAAGYEGGLSVTISADGGETIANRTMNPALGIEGGISIIGTSGIVEPMSEQALIDTIAVSLHQAASEQEGEKGAASENGSRSPFGRDRKQVILTPGNYGEEYIGKSGIGALGLPVVLVSNFIGEALDLCAEEGFTDVLLAGHAGKLVKLAGGLMNTHSMYGDCRMEILSAYAAMAGASSETVKKIMACATTDAATEVLKGAGLFEDVASAVTAAIDARLQRKAGGAFRVGAVVFSKVHGVFGLTDGARRFLEENGFHMEGEVVSRKEETDR